MLRTRVWLPNPYPALTLPLEDGGVAITDVDDKYRATWLPAIVSGRPVFVPAEVTAVSNDGSRVTVSTLLVPRWTIEVDSSVVVPLSAVTATDDCASLPRQTVPELIYSVSRRALEGRLTTRAGTNMWLQVNGYAGYDEARRERGGASGGLLVGWKGLASYVRAQREAAAVSLLRQDTLSPSRKPPPAARQQSLSLYSIVDDAMTAFAAAPSPVAIVLSGISGAGKTEAFKALLQYACAKPLLDRYASSDAPASSAIVAAAAFSPHTEVADRRGSLGWPGNRFLAPVLLAAASRDEHANSSAASLTSVPYLGDAGDDSYSFMKLPPATARGGSSGHLQHSSSALALSRSDSALLAAQLVLDAFGSVPTRKNGEHSACARMVSLPLTCSRYGRQQRVRREESTPASLSALLLTPWRVVAPAPGSAGRRTNFRVFYLLVAGAPRALRSQLSLGAETDYLALGSTQQQQQASAYGGGGSLGAGLVSPSLSSPPVNRYSSAAAAAAAALSPASPRVQTNGNSFSNGSGSSSSRSVLYGHAATTLHDAEEFDALCVALGDSGAAAAGPQQSQLWRLLSALLMAGNVVIRDRGASSQASPSPSAAAEGVTAPPPGSAEISNPSEALLLADILGVDRGALLHTLVKRTRGVVSAASGLSGGSEGAVSGGAAVTFAYKRGEDARAALQWIVSTSYARLFRWLLAQMNRHLRHLAADAAAAAAAAPPSAKLQPQTAPSPASTAYPLILYDGPGFDDVFPGSPPPSSLRDIAPSVGSPPYNPSKSGAAGGYAAAAAGGGGGLTAAAAAAVAAAGGEAWDGRTMDALTGCGDDSVRAVFAGSGSVYGFDALCTHFAVERLHAIAFLGANFHAESVRYATEGLVASLTTGLRTAGFSIPYTDNAPVCDFLGDPRTGLLPLLDEAAEFSRSSDALFYAKLVTMHRRSECMVPATVFSGADAAGRSSKQQQQQLLQLVPAPPSRRSVGAAGSLPSTSFDSVSGEGGSASFTLTPTLYTAVEQRNSSSGGSSGPTPPPSSSASSVPLLFGIRHTCGIVPYSAEGFLATARECTEAADLGALLGTSSVPLIATLFARAHKREDSILVEPSTSTPTSDREGSSGSTSSSSDNDVPMRFGCSDAVDGIGQHHHQAVYRPSAGGGSTTAISSGFGGHSGSSASVCESLRSDVATFYAPLSGAGLSGAGATQTAATSGAAAPMRVVSVVCLRQNVVSQPSFVDPALVHLQLRASGVGDVLRLQAEGLTSHLSFDAFYDSFVLLAHGRSAAGLLVPRPLSREESTAAAAAAAAAARNSGSGGSPPSSPSSLLLSAHTARAAPSARVLCERLLPSLLRLLPPSPADAATADTGGEIGGGSAARNTGSAQNVGHGSTTSRSSTGSGGTSSGGMKRLPPVHVGVTAVLIRVSALESLQRARDARFTALHAAAGTVQRVFRGWLCRALLRVVRDGLMRLQATWRAVLAREAWLARRRAVRRVQAAVRAWLARSKYAALHSAITRLQSQHRAHRRRAALGVARAGVAALHACARGFEVRAHIVDLLAAAVRIQAAARGFLVRACIRRVYTRAAVSFQAAWRGFALRCRSGALTDHLAIARRARRLARDARVIQSAWRGHTTRHQFLALRCAAVKIARAVRLWRARCRRAERIAAARAIQAHARGMLARRAVRARRALFLTGDELWDAILQREKEGDEIASQQASAAALLAAAVDAVSSAAPSAVLQARAAAGAASPSVVSGKKAGAAGKPAAAAGAANDSAAVVGGGEGASSSSSSSSSTAAVHRSANTTSTAGGAAAATPFTQVIGGKVQLPIGISTELRDVDVTGDYSDAYGGGLLKLKSRGGEGAGATPATAAAANGTWAQLFAQANALVRSAASSTSPASASSPSPTFAAFSTTSLAGLHGSSASAAISTPHIIDVGLESSRTIILASTGAVFTWGEHTRVPERLHVTLGGFVSTANRTNSGGAIADDGNDTSAAAALAGGLGSPSSSKAVLKTRAKPSSAPSLSSSGASPYASSPPGAIQLRIKSVACGEAHTLLVSDAGLLFAIGSNRRGQCGHPLDVSSPPFRPASVDESHEQHALQRPGLVRFPVEAEERGTGSSSSGGGGVFSPSASSSLMTSSQQSPRVSSVAAGAAFSLALMEDGRVFAFGASEMCRGDALPTGHKQQQLPPSEGSTPRLSGSSPTPLLDASDVFTPRALRVFVRGTQSRARHVSAGPDYAAVVTVGGDVYTWGVGSCGQLGLGEDAIERPPPYGDHGEVEDGANSEIDALIVVGRFHACAAPTLVVGLGALSPHNRVVRVSCGAHHVLALTSTGRVIVWGSNSHGQLGVGCVGPVTEDRLHEHGVVPSRLPSLLQYDGVTLSGNGWRALSSTPLTMSRHVFERAAAIARNNGYIPRPYIPVPALLRSTEPFRVEAIATGSRSSLALVDNHVALAWGCTRATTPPQTSLLSSPLASFHSAASAAAAAAPAPSPSPSSLALVLSPTPVAMPQVPGRELLGVISAYSASLSFQSLTIQQRPLSASALHTLADNYLRRGVSTASTTVPLSSAAALSNSAVIGAASAAAAAAAAHAHTAASDARLLEQQQRKSMNSQQQQQLLAALQRQGDEGSVLHAILQGSVSRVTESTAAAPLYLKIAASSFPPFSAAGTGDAMGESSAPAARGRTRDSMLSPRDARNTTLMSPRDAHSRSRTGMSSPSPPSLPLTSNATRGLASPPSAPSSALVWLSSPPSDHKASRSTETSASSAAARSALGLTTSPSPSAQSNAAPASATSASLQRTDGGSVSRRSLGPVHSIAPLEGEGTAAASGMKRSKIAFPLTPEDLLYGSATSASAAAAGAAAAALSSRPLPQSPSREAAVDRRSASRDVEAEQQRDSDAASGSNTSVNSHSRDHLQHRRTEVAQQQQQSLEEEKDAPRVISALLSLSPLKLTGLSPADLNALLARLRRLAAGSHSIGNSASASSSPHGDGGAVRSGAVQNSLTERYEAHRDITSAVAAEAWAASDASGSKQQGLPQPPAWRQLLHSASSKAAVADASRAALVDPSNIHVETFFSRERLYEVARALRRREASRKRLSRRSFIEPRGPPEGGYHHYYSMAALCPQSAPLQARIIAPSVRETIAAAAATLRPAASVVSAATTTSISNISNTTVSSFSPPTTAVNTPRDAVVSAYSGVQLSEARQYDTAVAAQASQPAGNNLTRRPSRPAPRAYSMSLPQQPR